MDVRKKQFAVDLFQSNLQAIKKNDSALFARSIAMLVQELEPEDVSHSRQCLSVWLQYIERHSIESNAIETIVFSLIELIQHPNDIDLRTTTSKLILDYKGFEKLFLMYLLARQYYRSGLRDYMVDVCKSILDLREIVYSSCLAEVNYIKVWAISVILQSKGQFDKERSQLNKGFELAMSNNWPFRQVSMEFAIGLTFYAERKYKEAEKILKVVLETAGDSRLGLNARRDLARVLKHESKYDEALLALKELKILESSNGDLYSVLSTQIQIASTLHVLGNYHEAIRELNEASKYISIVGDSYINSLLLFGIVREGVSLGEFHVIINMREHSHPYRFQLAKSIVLIAELIDRRTFRLPCKLIKNILFQIAYALVNTKKLLNMSLKEEIKHIWR
jgi:tetratricopeptide (TPR) repeat protein